MRDVVPMALASAGCVNAQADSTRAISRDHGQLIEAITSVWAAPVSESRNQNSPVYTLTGNVDSMAVSTSSTMGFIGNTNVDSTAVSTSSTMGFIGNTQVYATTTASKPIAIHCRV